MKVSFSRNTILQYGLGLAMMASLVLEMVWIRYWSLLFGTTVKATSLVFGGFLLGFGFGSYFFGKKSSQGFSAIARLLRHLTLASLILFFMLWGLKALWLNGFAGFRGILLFVAWLCLLYPSFLMGGFFPLCAKSMKKEDVKKTLSSLYTADLVGAAVGVLLAGFILIPRWGLVLSYGFAILVFFILSLFFGRIKD